jgi:hypothetical protein
MQGWAKRHGQVRKEQGLRLYPVPQPRGQRKSVRQLPAITTAPSKRLFDASLAEWEGFLQLPQASRQPGRDTVRASSRKNAIIFRSAEVVFHHN